MRLAPPAIILVVAVLAAFFVLWPAPVDPSAVVGHWAHPDGLSNHWLLVWVAEQLLAGGSLLHNTAYYIPEGDYPLLAGNGAEGFLYLPFHLLLPWPASATAYATVLLVANILAGSWGAYRLGASAPASILGGIAYGASPYIVQELGSGRFTQADGVFFALTLAWALGTLRRVELGEPVRWWSGIEGGLLFGLTAIFYWYYGYFLVLSALVVLGALVVRTRGLPWHLAPPFVGTALLVVIGPLAWFVAHWAQIPGTAEATVFPHPEAWGDSLPLALPLHVRGAHQGAALSVAVLALVGSGAWLWRTRGPSRDRFTLGALAALVVLGWTLARGSAFWFGASPTPYELAYGWIEPLKRFWWPSRHVILIHFAMAMLAARALTSWLDGRSRAWLWSGLATLCVPGTLWLTGDLVQVPISSYHPTELYAQLDDLPDGALLELPLSPRLGGNQQMLIYQLEHGRPLFSGHAAWVDRVRPPAWSARLETNAFLADWIAFEEGRAGPQTFAAADIEALSTLGIRWVVHNREFVPTGMHQALDRALRDLFGNPVLKVDGSKVYDLTAYRGVTTFQTQDFRIDPEATLGNGTRPFVGRKPRSVAFELLRDTQMPFQGLAPPPPRGPR